MRLAERRGARCGWRGTARTMHDHTEDREKMRSSALTFDEVVALFAPFLEGGDGAGRRNAEAVVVAGEGKEGRRQQWPLDPHCRTMRLLQAMRQRGGSEMRETEQDGRQDGSRSRQR